MTVNLPSGTVTFLFTDIENSTKLWEGFPGAMKSILARHDEILRKAVEDHDGTTTTNRLLAWILAHL